MQAITKDQPHWQMKDTLKGVLGTSVAVGAAVVQTDLEFWLRVSLLVIGCVSGILTIVHLVIKIREALREKR